MKKLIVATALLAAISAPVSAEEQASCEQVARIAKHIMTAHQEGESLATIMGLAKGDGLIEKMTVQAYESNRYFSQEVQMREINGFRDRWYLLCYKAKALE